MDHPVGQLWAVYQSAEYYRNSPSSEIPLRLCTHLLFEPDPFIDRMGGMNPQVAVHGGTGLGFDELLEHIPWKIL
ncbi:MAG: hypothetical protein ACLSUW_06150 [Akkermansia sp.]